MSKSKMNQWSDYNKPMNFSVSKRLTALDLAATAEDIKQANIDAINLSSELCTLVLARNLKILEHLIEERATASHISLEFRLNPEMMEALQLLEELGNSALKKHAQMEEYLGSNSRSSCPRYESKYSQTDGSGRDDSSVNDDINSTGDLKILDNDKENLIDYNVDFSGDSGIFYYYNDK